MKVWPALDIASPDDLLHAALLDFGVAAIDDNAPDRWRVFFHTPEERDRALVSLTAEFPTHAMSPVDVPDEDWAARSQANLRAVRVGGLIVAPPWDVPARPPGARVVVIQPSMGFGTGHHATTRLCLAALQQIDLRGRSVVDVGTGSGVLAIAASLLGASPVVAIDDDPDAIQSAGENVELNPGAVVETRIVDLRATTLPPFDVVLANLTGGLLIQASQQLRALTAPGGYLVVSGLMKSEESAVLSTLNETGSELIGRAEEDEWVCVTLQR